MCDENEDGKGMSQMNEEPSTARGTTVQLARRSADTWTRRIMGAITLGLLMAASVTLAQNAIFGTAQLQAHEAPPDAFWAIRDPDFPYPRDLAKEGVTGCLIAEMDVTKSGKSKNVEIVYSFPGGNMERAFKRSLNRIRWVPIDEDRESQEEQRQVRVDFCASFASQEEARAICDMNAALGCD